MASPQSLQLASCGPRISSKAKAARKSTVRARSYSNTSHTRSAASPGRAVTNRHRNHVQAGGTCAAP
eukprot:1713372-Pyramimonas_sp.AAC.1